MDYQDFLDCYEGYQKRQIDIDYQNWMLGQYMCCAYGASQSKKNKYPPKPFLTPKKAKKDNFTLQELKDDDKKFEEMMRKRGVNVR